MIGAIRGKSNGSDANGGVSAPAPDIDVSRPHALSKENARAGVEALAVALGERLGGLQSEWRGDLLLLHADSGIGKGTSGSVLVGEKELRARVVLPVALKLAKSSLTEKLISALEAAAEHGGQ